jgi:hypothetical protein
MRPTPDEATVTAATRSTSGKDVTSPTPAQIVWFSTEPEQLTLDLDHGVRVPVTTVVGVTATYTGASCRVFYCTILCTVRTCTIFQMHGAENPTQSSC